MEFKMIIRNETISDIEAISKITIAAFQNLAISNHTEQFIINALRNANALTISLVAEIDGKVVGHIAFSPVTISDGAITGMASALFLYCRSIKNRALENPLSVKDCPYLKIWAAKVVFLWVIRTTINGSALEIFQI